MDAYVKLALDTIRTYVLTGQAFRPEAKTLPKEMLSSRAGAFVSIHKGGDLRGCIGTIGPVRSSLMEEIMENAIAAASEDPRFLPVTKEELDFLQVSVDVLMKPEPVTDLSLLDVKRYGVIVEKGRRRGLLLPDLPGVDSPAMQLSIARRKAGIGDWEEGVSVCRFEVIRHE